LKRDAERLSSHLRLGNGGTIGLLLGGSNPEFSLTKEIVNQVIDGLSQFHRERGIEFLVTTSRRTSPDAEAILKNRLRNDPGCKLLVIANERNMEEAVGGILGLSKIVVVSGESISMISEAISSGRRVIVFGLKKKQEVVVKHERVLRELEDEGCITICDAKNLGACLKEAWNGPPLVNRLNDNERIFEAVRRLM
jgi:mitochondrial fission protein ELM1